MLKEENVCIYAFCGWQFDMLQVDCIERRLLNTLIIKQRATGLKTGHKGKKKRVHVEEQKIERERKKESSITDLRALPAPCIDECPPDRGRHREWRSG